MNPDLANFLPKVLLPQSAMNNFKAGEPGNMIFNNPKMTQFPQMSEEPSPFKGNVKQEEEYSKEVSDENIREFQIPAKWEWLPCNYELKKEADGIETHWSLAPTIQLAGADPKISPTMDIQINLERNFMHSEELGWNWHKSWNLPNVTCSIKITDPKTNEMILPPADLKAQLLAVKVLLNKAEQFKLYDLGLKGPATQDLSEGQAVFSGIKFSSTSYNNDSKKVVHKYFDPFPPETFDKTFIKRNSKFNEAKEETIENSLEGLSQYFTAPNIRNKVKHPIFLASKFSNCVKLFYNSNLIKPPSDGQLKEEDLIEKMQKIFMESHTKSKGKTDSNAGKAFDNKHFILLIEEPNNIDSFHLNKKISDYLDPIINEVLHVIFNSNITPPHFKEVPNDRLAKSYNKVYSTLLHIKNSYAGFPGEESEKGRKTPQSKIRSIVCFSDDVNKKRDRDEGSDESDDEEIKDETPDVSKKVKASEPLEAAFKKVSITGNKFEQKRDNFHVKNEDNHGLHIENMQDQNELKKKLASDNMNFLNNITSNLSKSQKPEQKIDKTLNQLIMKNMSNLSNIQQTNLMGQFLPNQNLQPNPLQTQLPPQNLQAQNLQAQSLQQTIQNQGMNSQTPQNLQQNLQPTQNIQQTKEISDLVASLQQEQKKNQLLLNFLAQQSQPQNRMSNQQNLLQQIHNNNLQPMQMQSNPLQQIQSNPLQQIQSNPLQQIQNNPLQQIQNNPLQQIQNTQMQQIQPNLQQYQNNSLQNINNILPMQNSLQQLHMQSNGLQQFQMQQNPLQQISYQQQQQDKFGQANQNQNLLKMMSNQNQSSSNNVLNNILMMNYNQNNTNSQLGLLPNMNNMRGNMINNPLNNLTGLNNTSTNPTNNVSLESLMMRQYANFQGNNQGSK